VAIGYQAGQLNQSGNSVAIGINAGRTNQAGATVAIGQDAAGSGQRLAAIAVGSGAGQTSQGTFAIAMGYIAGIFNQGTSAVALGQQAGRTNQGQNAIAIGCQAGENNQPARSIFINASGSALNGTQVDATYIRPIRQANSSRLMYYDPVNYEVVQDVNVRQSDPSAASTPGSGCIGEVRSSSGSATNQFSNTNIFVCSLTLPAGLWLITSRHEVSGVAPIFWTCSVNPGISNIGAPMGTTNTFYNATGNATFNSTNPFVYLVATSQTFQPFTNVSNPISSSFTIGQQIQAVRLA
jgi:hypothetical protein